MIYFLADLVFCVRNNLATLIVTVSQTKQNILIFYFVLQSSLPYINYVLVFLHQHGISKGLRNTMSSYIMIAAHVCLGLVTVMIHFNVCQGECTVLDQEVGVKLSKATAPFTELQFE